MERQSRNQAFPSVHAFNTFFFTTLVNGGYSRVRRWTRKVRLFEKDIVIVPVHLGVHWCCVSIWPKKNLIYYYDSLGGDGRRTLDLLLDYLELESQDKLNKPLDKSIWDAQCPKDIPLQKNGYDCGVFACAFAEHLTRESNFNFSQRDMKYLRKKMMIEIINQELIT
ncbi:SUMO1 sentrin specific peptidase 1 [Spiromyces aspiralis]|uniref:SUMO1 sentrin specific peptidase 1 n=1 Tax=Spiromyces aspiralis TaxID=68401 RepID=A0ACC1HEG3_9FUNG|nr:SUMO1 sentrin specific peptidase 1 [Spiromyces aspiralis]